MDTLIHRRNRESQAGTNPKVICRVRSGWMVLGDGHVLPGDALLAVTDVYRINYETLGNTEPALHAHVFPRYESEPAELRKSPAWCYD